MITPLEINAAYDNMTAQTINFRDAELAHIAAQQDLEANRLSKTAAGEIAGKNADEREASARVILSDLYGKADIARVNERVARCAFDLASLDVERVKMLVRLAELTKEGGA